MPIAILNRNAKAWLALICALALHVLDETLTDFLPLYNRLITDLREDLPLLPFPTFTFPVWLGGLILGILIGFLLTPWIGRGGRAPRFLATAFGALMIVNGIGHLVGSIALGRPAPGVWSSPFLVAAAIWVFRRGIAGDWTKGAEVAAAG